MLETARRFNTISHTDSSNYAKATFIIERANDNSYVSMFSQLILSNYSYFALFASAQLKKLISLILACETIEKPDFQKTVSSVAAPTKNFSANNSFSFWAPQTESHINTLKQNTSLRALNPLMKFKDGSTPIFYAEKNLVILTLMKNKEDKLTPLENSFILEEGYLPVLPSYTGLTLISLPNNKWVIHDGLNNTLTNPEPNSSYAFVTMPDKSIRITPRTDTVHIMLSSASPAVRYAGNLTFGEKNEIVTWDNLSGAYRPDASLAHQAGFNPNDLKQFYSPIIRVMP
jgi:hypothetical protein